ncbi:MAG: Do family serine endopeptidase [Longimicrobiales bacterium]
MFRMRIAAHAALMAGFVVVAGCGGEEGAQAQEREALQQDVRERLGVVPAAIDTATAGALSKTFRNAASRALAAVVFIEVEQQPQTAQRRGQLPLPFPFFDDVPDRQGQMPPAIGQGSGFIFDRRGYIMTNNHVVEDARRVSVTMLDGRVFQAQVVGTDPNSDVAVIKVEPAEGQELPIVRFGSSDRLNVGDWVLALGNPFGLDFTVTAGIVSALGRNLGIIRSRGGEEMGGRTAIESFIQTDAAINRGNSGGPLVNLLGDVVGINTAIFSETGVSAGYGFAIPISLASKIASDLIEFGYVRRPQLGVLVQEITEVDAEVYGLSEVRGAEVVQVQPGSPAAEARLQIRDVILAVDGDRIQDDTELITRLAQMQPGEEVTLTVVRDRQRRDVRVELGEFERPQPQRREAVAQRTSRDLLGFSVAPLTQQVAQQLELDAQRRRRGGVVITEVLPYTPARQAGVPPGAIVLEINGREVNGVGDVERVAAALEPGQAVSLVIVPPVGAPTEQVINYRASQ